MKKLLFVFAIAALFVQGVWSSGEPEVVLDTNIDYVKNISGRPEFNIPDDKFKFDFGDYNKRVYFFSGFKFEDFQRNHPAIVGLNAYERAVISSETRGAPYAIIGHSQGGLRALGYISQLEKNLGNPNLIDAVITTSGIDQGLQMLEGGIYGFKARATDKINIIANGISSVLGVFPIIDMGILFIDGTGIPLGEIAFNLIASCLSEQWRNYGFGAWTFGNVPQQIQDMVPGSHYIKNNILNTREYTYKKLIRYETVVEWGLQTLFWGIKVPYFRISLQPIYSYYKVMETTPQFNDKVPVGFIVGTDSNTLDMLNPDKDNNEAENEARGWIKGFEGLCAVTETAHYVKNAFIWGLFTGSPLYASYANRARRLFANVDSELNDLKLSVENDGMVAKSHQYIPRAVLKNLVLGGRNEGYVPLHYTHDKMGIEKWNNNPPEAIMTARDMIIDGESERRRQGLR